jgi:ADP-heptose:LPS heptosyltransferase
MRAAGCDGLITDLSGSIKDFADSAIVLEALDLLITVDTSPAHLAGALGKPVGMLLPYVPNWRWLLERDDSPWYPSLRLFRQERPNDWSTPLRRLAEALKTRAGETAAGSSGSA